jgi:hypothetical protein
MTRKKETKIGDAEVTSGHMIWPIAKSHLKRDQPKAPTAVHGPSCLKFDTLNAVADCLENRFTSHDVCDRNDERRVEGRDQALLEAADSSPPERVRPCDC